MTTRLARAEAASAPGLRSPFVPLATRPSRAGAACVFALALCLPACGSSQSSSTGSKQPFPQCFADASVSGAYTAQGKVSGPCGMAYARDAKSVHLGSPLFNGDAGFANTLLVKVYGLDESTGNVTLPAGVLIDPDGGQTTWQAGMWGAGGDCLALIESQKPTINSWTLVTTTVTCSAPLLETNGTAQSKLDHLRLQSVYGP